MFLIIYKIGQIFPSFHKKLIQTFISGLDAPRCSVWVKKKRAISKDVLFLPFFTLSPLFSTLDDFFYLSLFVPDPSAGLSSCLGCQYITGAHFWLNEDSGDMSVVRAASPEIGNNKARVQILKALDLVSTPSTAPDVQWTRCDGQWARFRVKLEIIRKSVRFWAEFPAVLVFSESLSSLFASYSCKIICKLYCH